jgi:polysaccharide export outer membrane protein
MRTAVRFLCGALALALFAADGFAAGPATPATRPQPMAPAAAPAPAPTVAPVPDYRLAPGDALHIIVYQNPDLTLDTRLSDSGYISFPLLGNVKLGGLTVSESENLIANGLRKGDFIRNPQVTIVITQLRNQVSVLGQVNRPGRYPLEQAQTHLSDVLALAGGVVAVVGGDTVTVVGDRNGKPMRLEVDLPHLFAANGRGDDILMQNGDAIWVDRAPQIYIYGEVQRPGAFRLERDMTLMQALASGGGLTQRGTEKGIRVHRRGPDGQVQVLQPGMDEKLRDGDVVYVRESLF